MNENIKILLFARINSERLPKKALLDIKGKPAIAHLMNRLKYSRYETIVCLPENEGNEIVDIAKKYNFEVFRGNSESPLKRMVEAIDEYKIDHVIRITHDDILIDVKIMESMVNFYLGKNPYHKIFDYTYCCKTPEGTGCEIMKASTIKNIENKIKDKNIEGISHYFKSKDYECMEYIPHYSDQGQHIRCTLDYEEDYNLLKVLHSYLVFPFFAKDILHVYRRHPEFWTINKLPKISVYITNYNLGNYLEEAIQSVLNQTFTDFELIIIDDCSTEKKSVSILKKYSLNDKVKIIWNEKNEGLPASRNKAIKHSKGDFVMGVDADDVLMEDALEKTFNWLNTNNNNRAVYCGYLHGNDKLEIFEEVLENKDHHPSCTLINKRAYNEVKYQEDLTGYESHDFYLKFSKYFDIGYINKPLWKKRNRDNSMSNTNLKERKIIKEKIDGNN